MGLLSEERSQELTEKLELSFSEQSEPTSVTEDVKPQVEAAPAAEEVAEARDATPDVPVERTHADAKAGESEARVDAESDDGSDDADSSPPGHRVPYKRFKNILEARNKYRGEAENASAQVESFKQQVESMRNEVAMMRNLQHAKPAENESEVSDELDRLLNGSPDLPKEVKDKMAMMEARLHQQEVHAERVRLRQEVADVTGSYDKNLTTDLQQVLYSAVQRDPNVDLGRVAEQYTTWLAKREEDAIARYLEKDPGASVEEAEAQVAGVPSRPKRAGTGASRVARPADKKTYGTIKEGTEALFKAMENGDINLFG